MVSSSARCRTVRSASAGMALPSALLLVMVLAISGAMFSKASIQNLKIVSLQDATSDTFQIAEGAVHDIIRQMSVRPNLWRTKAPIGGVPAGYTAYSPLSFAATNGIPSCTGANCIRSLYPASGGLIKNFGPIGGDGDSVNTSREVYNQLNPSAPPSSDLVLNGLAGWSQVEHMDEVLPTGSASLGADLTTNAGGGYGASNIRFRITGKTFKTVKDRQGEATVVIIVELPAV